MYNSGEYVTYTSNIFEIQLKGDQMDKTLVFEQPEVPEPILESN